MKSSEPNASDDDRISATIGERVLYGLGTAVFALGPLLIPGVSIYKLGAGLLGFASVAFAVLCVLATIKSARKPLPRRSLRQ